MEDLAAGFDLARFGRAPARFDEAELHRVNAAIVHRLPFERVARLLPEGMSAVAWDAIRPNLGHIGEAAEWWQVVTGPVAHPGFDEAELHRVNAAIVHRLPFERVARLLPEGMSAAAWDAIRPNLTHIGEAAEWWQVVTGPVTPPEFDEETAGYLLLAADALEAQTWGADPWPALTSALKDATGRKGKPLFLPLRQALTGRDHGPDMAAMLPLIGRDEALARLRQAAG
jgi:glutamyl/glutaminyl-tRNA synthetase